MKEAVCTRQPLFEGGRLKAEGGIQLRITNYELRNPKFRI